MADDPQPPHYQRDGECPICEAVVTFRARHPAFRDHLKCSGCGSIPRERALAVVLNREVPAWRRAAIHESSPNGQLGISGKMRRECEQYVPTQFFVSEQLGTIVRGIRNENLERQTFPDGSFDIVVTLDVMEHVGEPADVCREISRTLRPGGRYIFTAPTFSGRTVSERRARYLRDGTPEHLVEPPEYHGNPLSPDGSLVTFHYGYDLPELIYQWSGLNVEVVRFHDHRHGLIGPMTEVYVARKC